MNAVVTPQPPVDRQRPSRFLGLVNAMPVLIFRSHLNWLLAPSLVMVTHRGRRTGRVFQTVLEAVHHDRRTGECVVVAAHGPASDWFRNLQTAPALAIQIGRQRFAPEQRLLTMEEAEAVWEEQERRRPRYAGFSQRALTRRLGQANSTPAERRRFLATALPMVSFRPAQA